MVSEWRPVSSMSTTCLTLVFYREHIQLTPLSLTMSATNSTTLAELASHIADAGTGIASCLTELTTSQPALCASSFATVSWHCHSRLHRAVYYNV